MITDAELKKIINLGKTNFDAFHNKFPDQGEWSDWPPKWNKANEKDRWISAASSVKLVVLTEVLEILGPDSGFVSENEDYARGYDAARDEIRLALQRLME